MLSTARSTAFLVLSTAFWVRAESSDALFSIVAASFLALRSTTLPSSDARSTLAAFVLAVSLTFSSVSRMKFLARPASLLAFSWTASPASAVCCHRVYSRRSHCCGVREKRTLPNEGHRWHAKHSCSHPAPDSRKPLRKRIEFHTIHNEIWHSISTRSERSAQPFSR